MFRITISDLVYRRRQFLIATLGAGLVFAMTLLLAGLVNGFSVEINQTVSGFRADAWMVKAGSAGRVASLTPMAQSAVARAAATPGVTDAVPVVVIPQTADVAGKLVQVNLIGAPVASAPATQPLTSGRQVTGPHQVVVDSSLGAALGSRITVGGRVFTVVGTTSDRTLLGGISNVYVGLADAQAVVFQGAPIISAVIVTGNPTSAPAGLTIVTNAQIEQASLDQMATAVSSINNSKLLMAAIAAVIVASLVYVTALERTRDFAVLKALGASSGQLYLGLAVQAVLVALLAALFAAVLAQFMTGVFSQPVDFAASDYVDLPVLAVVVGLLASLIALRRAVAADPARAFAG